MHTVSSSRSSSSSGTLGGLKKLKKLSQSSILVAGFVFLDPFLGFFCRTFCVTFFPGYHSISVLFKITLRSTQDSTTYTIVPLVVWSIYCIYVSLPHGTLQDWFIFFNHVIDLCQLPKVWGWGFECRYQNINTKNYDILKRVPACSWNKDSLQNGTQVWTLSLPQGWGFVCLSSISGALHHAWLSVDIDC